MPRSIAAVMESFDGVDLPYCDVTGESVRDIASARSLVLSELKKGAAGLKRWIEADDASIRGQDENAATYRKFVAEMALCCPTHTLTTSSPISGTVRAVGGDRRMGLLDDVSVAAPPVALRCRENGAGVGAICGVLIGASAESLVDSETPLLQSSPYLSQSSAANDTLKWTEQELASQSTLDGIFFESLVSQKLNLDLWMDLANPREVLQCLLEDVGRKAQALCEETALLDGVNAARFSEQRDYKRRRSAIASQTAKSRAKVTSLEALLGVGCEDEEEEGEVTKRVRAADRLCLLLQD